ncbi:gamma-glutamyltransferase [bacterium M00.F.Ca.ET.228.01.1.1]|uniref:gamma-glutamyltransferase n=1 Tax=Paraburkholderia phenoliruptrix TaxID=252970 RepID=UPI001092DA09|nr:gamma-glutamyltransferase [Paraburkholderia phenoliruptrix]TGP43681.1 gamma-glutamyltransferase [bacterium M00.F.Ca.ET.228.01.1.1]TGS01343.1 gamma-glutamyltransferase [bacterium M00.F.Ca.ET.191.01.1.1]TGU09051.1 gamma-glutamyltransferase [bacterium M00.F.Ca.ET.155.01.1.1]MBW0449445.1 gamma-glutamyltransferase [Paraburkholderia phenoliruptrix]MBW9097726.1 gamma-glutamyltransferase [Paraburkholderia phenoliruptrix]
MPMPTYDAPRAPDAFTFAFTFSAARFAPAVLMVAVAAAVLAPASTLARTAVPKALFDASAVATPDRYSADAAQQIFAAGGNAVDAAVAIAFTLAVTRPDSGNLGGGGFMTLYVDGKPYFLDYRERAPQQATRDMYLDDKGNAVPGLSTVGHRAVAVPGTVDGMWQAQQRFGKLKWKQVLAPAIRYATDGFQVDLWLQQRRDATAKNFAARTNFDAYFAGLKAGSTFRQPELAQTLSRIASDGGREFYEGRTAGLIAQQMYGHGLVTKADLQQYKAVWRQPLRAEWNGYEVLTAPPPSSGGVGLIQMLKMKAHLQQAFDGLELNSAPYIHLIAQIEDRVFADRQQYIGDPDSYKLPVDKLLDDAYLAQRADEVKTDEVPGAAAIKPGLGDAPPEKAQTTHFSVVDKWGNAVSNTTTLDGEFGSGVVVDGAGFLLNDAMDDFVTKPTASGESTASGADLNTVLPGRRPLSSMTPTIVLKDNKVSLVIGTPGGSRILTSIFQVVTDLYDFGMTPADALAAMRFHHQLLPQKTIYFEPYRPIAGELAAQLQALGYVLEGQSFNGDVQVIRIDGTTLEPAADPRGMGVGRVIR